MALGIHSPAMAEQSTSRSPGVDPNGSSEASEFAALRAEVERLRELLIARDAELGQARGRLEQLEERTNRVLGAAVFLRRLGPPFARLRAQLRGRG
jgi:hypothetical protein